MSANTTTCTASVPWPHSTSCGVVGSAAAPPRALLIAIRLVAICCTAVPTELVSLQCVRLSTISLVPSGDALPCACMCVDLLATWSVCVLCARVKNDGRCWVAGVIGCSGVSCLRGYKHTIVAVAACVCVAMCCAAQFWGQLWAGQAMGSTSQVH